MEFKQYVKMILEADKKAEDKNKKADEFDDEEEDDDEELDDDEEASCKTHKNCTGCEASVEDDDDDDDEDFDDEDEDDDDDEEKSHKKSLKESMIYSSNYINGNNYNVINEEKEISMVLSESIKNNSASKFLAKQSKKAEKEAAKLSSRGKKEEAKLAKDAAKSLKEASSKLYKAEIEYKAGNPEAKKEYKKICKAYSKVLKQKGKALRGIGKFTASLFGTVAGAALLGLTGLTALANDDIIDRLEDGIKNDNLIEVIKGMAIKDKVVLKEILMSAQEGMDKDMEYRADWEKEGAFHNTIESVKKTAKRIGRDAYKNDGYHDGREALGDLVGVGAAKLGIKNKDGETLNYKEIFGKKK